jgi:hypothetical protein
VDGAEDSAEAVVGAAGSVDLEEVRLAVADRAAVGSAMPDFSEVM